MCGNTKAFFFLNISTMALSLFNSKQFSKTLSLYKAHMEAGYSVALDTTHNRPNISSSFDDDDEQVGDWNIQAKSGFWNDSECLGMDEYVVITCHPDLFDVILPIITEMVGREPEDFDEGTYATWD